MSTAPGGGSPHGKMRAAVAASTLVLLALAIPLLFVSNRPPAHARSSADANCDHPGGAYS